MYSTMISGTVRGIDSYLVQVEADVSNGMPCMELIGFLGSEVKEAKERVRAALGNLSITLPPKRITVNLSPAHIRKAGSNFDLPIAVCILAALGHIQKEHIKDIMMIGELGLNGEIKAVRGVLPIVMEAKENDIKICIVPSANEYEGSIIQGIRVIGMDKLSEVVKYLHNPDKKEEVYKKKNNKMEVYEKEDKTKEDKTNENKTKEDKTKEGKTIEDKINEDKINEDKTKEVKSIKVKSDEEKLNNKTQQYNSESYEIDFSDINGQESVKRAAEVAAAGFHHMLMIGPPGSGKTMIAQRIRTILPPLSMQESLEVSKIYSVSGMLNEKEALITRRPFVNPHHTSTSAALIGGGSVPRPGALSLAHRGILFLDELPEFKRSILDTMRQPLEEKQIHIARSYGTFTYPADVMLIAAMNPCPCGYYPDMQRCRCKEYEVKRYVNHISGPFLDRMDICIDTPKLEITELLAEANGESSETIKNRVLRAREIQKKRYEGSVYHFNAQLQSGDIKKFLPLSIENEKMLERIYKKMSLSVRGYHKIIKTARTIADLSGSTNIKEIHISEALHYRMSDRKYFER